ncbi:hypothetical protein ACIP5Y_26365 [Nocardia sp. NPDC088792]|uniref:hypothetical protein n=1 Tax=Nocardia sp. NPDC088792 TaxID=3364332 RepID=UPI0038217FB9
MSVSEACPSAILALAQGNAAWRAVRDGRSGAAEDQRVAGIWCRPSARYQPRSEDLSVAGVTVEPVSVNINVSFSIRELRVERERAGVAVLLTDVLESEGLSSEVFVTFGGDGESLSVTVDSDRPVIFSRFYSWQDPFEAMLTSRVTALLPHAELVFDWEYADED